MLEKDLGEHTRPRKQTKMLELTLKILATVYLSEDRSRSNLMANKYLLDSTYIFQNFSANSASNPKLIEW